MSFWWFVGGLGGVVRLRWLLKLLYFLVGDAEWQQLVQALRKLVAKAGAETEQKG